MAATIFNSTPNLETSQFETNVLAGYLQISNNLSDVQSATTSRLNLGLVLGTDVQEWDAQLDDIAALAVTNSNFIVGDGTNWVAETGATARTSLGLGTIATQNSNAVTITGGSITGITDITVADGGTGASTVRGAQYNLGIGVKRVSPVVKTTDQEIEPIIVNGGEDFFGIDGFIDRNPIDGTMVIISRNDTLHTATANASIVMSTSTDNGYSWSTPVCIHNSASYYYHNFNGGYTHTGRLIIVGRRYPDGGIAGESSYYNFMIMSDDNGATWTAEAEFDMSGVTAEVIAANGPLVRMDNGSIGIPLATHGWSAYPTVDERNAHYFVSDDDGVTWTANLMYQVTGDFTTMAEWVPTEPTVCDLGGGQLVCLMRDESYYNIGGGAFDVPSGSLQNGETYWVMCNDVANPIDPVADYVTYDPGGGNVNFTPGETFTAGANANYAANGDTEVRAGCANFVQFVSNDYGATWTEVGFTEFDRNKCYAKRNARVYKVTCGGVPMVVCYYSTFYELEVKCVYARADEVMDTTSRHLAWDKESVTIVDNVGLHRNLGYCTAVHVDDGETSVFGLVVYSDDDNGTSKIRVTPVSQEVSGKIMMSTLQA